MRNRSLFGICGRFYRRAALPLLAGGSLFGGFLESCNDRLVGITRYVDPCGTILANCTPGTFETLAADIGDYCVDPTCTVPGGCGPGQPLGTIIRVCP